MSEMQRDEVKARIEASEARMATLAELVRSEAVTARAEITVGFRDLRAINDSIKADAAVFHAEAGRTFADLHRAHAANKADTYALGYRVATWVFGTLLTLMTLALAMYKAWRDFPS